MKILVFSQYYRPEQFLLSEICEELVCSGHEVSVITGLPNYPEGVIPKEYKFQKNRDQLINGVHVKRCSIIPRGRNKLQLILNYLSYMINARIKSLSVRGDYDIVILFQLTPILQAYPAIKYCRKHQKKLVTYCYDLAPKSGSQLLDNRNPIKKLYARFSAWAYQSCDVIAVTSKSFINYLVTVNNVRSDKIVYLPQHASDIFLKDEMTTNNNGIIDFMFAGNLGLGASLETIVNAAEELAGKESFLIHFVGDGAACKEIRRSIADKQIEQYFVFHGQHPIEEMPDYYRIADALLIVLRKGQITIPGKLQTYMSVGKPVLGALDGSGADIINESMCGKCVAAQDHRGLADIMREFIHNPNAFEEYGENGREYFLKNFTKEHFIENFNKILVNQIKG